MQNLDDVAKQVSILDEPVSFQRPQIGYADLVLEQCGGVDLSRSVDAVLVKDLLEIAPDIELRNDPDELSYGSVKCNGTWPSTVLTFRPVRSPVGIRLSERRCPAQQVHKESPAWISRGGRPALESDLLGAEVVSWNTADECVLEKELATVVPILELGIAAQ
jgi:hypothetical protein